jgi:hypothetical protein
MPIVKSVTKFNPTTDFTEAQVQEVVRIINAGSIPDTRGGRYYLFMGWRFDIGNRPYLVQHADGHIERCWAQCIGALRKSLHLTRNDRVVADPFADGKGS